MHSARDHRISGQLLMSEDAKAAKCAYLEKVGAVYYVRKRIPRASKGRGTGEMLRLSLRTKERTRAIRLALEALAVFEDLLRLEPQDALNKLTRYLVDEQLRQPAEMTGADLIRRRALGSAGAKIIRRARQELHLGEHLDGIYQELVHFNHATVKGEAIHDQRGEPDGMPASIQKQQRSRKSLQRCRE